MSDFFKMIRAVRMMKGVKQSEIAQLLEVRQQSVSKLENGKTRISKEVAYKIARHLGFRDQFEMKAFYDSHISTRAVQESHP
ncbi:MAG: helix-turn-helix domain-containing protein [Dyadobacter fermentans]